MKVLIDLPEERYNWIKEHKGVTDFQTTEMLYKRVRKGKVIEGDFNIVRPAHTVGESGKWVKRTVATSIEQVDTVEPLWYCSRCGAVYDGDIAEKLHFCARCGDRKKDSSDELRR